MVIITSQIVPAPLAQATGWWDMGRRFREGGTALEPAHLLTFFAVVAAISVFLWLLSRYFQRDGGQQPHRGPRRLFLQLCREHQLSVSECWLLWRLAKANQLRQPAVVFVDASQFDVASLPKRFQREQQRLGRLRDRLFA